MRIAAAVAAAALLAGFTVQDAEKALDGGWSGMSAAIALEIDAKARSAKVTRGGQVVQGPFKVESVSAGAATVSIGGDRYVLHVRNEGKVLIMSPVGSTSSTYLNRVD